MPKYLVELHDGRKFQVEADSEPSEAEVMAAAPKSEPSPFSKRGGMSDPAMVSAPTAPKKEDPDPETVGTLASHFVDQVNPVGVGQMLPWPKALGGGGLTAPWQTIKNLGAAQGAVFDKAVASAKAGEYPTAIRHGINYLLPGVGPVLDKGQDNLHAGHYAAGIGDTLGFGTAMVLPAAATHVAPLLRATLADSAFGEKLAASADAGATSRIADVMTPKTGANKVRFSNMAKNVAGDVARRTTGWSREGIQASVADNLEHAGTMLDASHDERLNAKSYDMTPVLDAVRGRKDRLTSHAVDASVYDGPHPQTPETGTGFNAPVASHEGTSNTLIRPETSQGGLSNINVRNTNTGFMAPVASHEGSAGALVRPESSQGGLGRVTARETGTAFYPPTGEAPAMTRGEGPTIRTRDTVSGFDTPPPSDAAAPATADIRGNPTLRTQETGSGFNSSLPSDTAAPPVHVDRSVLARGKPLGQDVIPVPFRPRAAMIDNGIDDLSKLGPVATYDAMRNIRQAYDGPAKAIYSPAMTADYMTQQGGKMGAADVTGAIREHLAKLDPVTDRANGEYSLWKNAHDVMQATEETERVRPTTGRNMFARGIGAGAGDLMGGGKGAIIGALVGPSVERALMGVAPAMKIGLARQMAQLADAIRAGDTMKVNTYLTNINKFAPAVSDAIRPTRTGQPPE